MNLTNNGVELRANIIHMLIRINNLLIKHGNSERLAGAYGLSQQQWTLLQVLYKSGQGMTMTELGKNLLVTKANMTGMIDRLERDGFVNRHPDQHDRRVTKVRLTDKGIDFLRAIEGPRSDFHADMFADFSLEDSKQFYQFLNQLFQRLDI